jgi:CBS-domain-containing membrane protein
MKIRDCMSTDVRMARPDDTLETAAQAMAEIDAGVMPVSDDDRLVGMITDRDIAVRGVAQGLGPEDLVSEVMSKDVMYCFEDEAVEQVLSNMGDIQLRRLPVLDRDKRLVGIVSLGDLAKTAVRATTGTALGDISRKGGRHSQTANGAAKAP